jgi:PhzF family phenazine biosynthesis protein
MAQKITQVDAFTDVPFRGNPAAVCILAREGSEPWMQQIAMEMNLSETAFLYPEKDGYRLRWFTPTIEVHLCGHATLASAHVLYEDHLLPKKAEARFYTRSGLLTARQNGSDIELNFPAQPAEPCEAPDGLAEALGVEPVAVGLSGEKYLVEVANEETVRICNPDFNFINALGIRSVIITSRTTDGDYDFVSRFFAPGAGINEDPVTGSAHCVLGPYWSKILNKTEFTAYQASRRGGVMRVRLDSDRVILAGSAVTVMRCQLAI